ncbi:hypothetical protein HAX54_029841 [Datura stramonium]|uniref:Uncharacterized protein n=1 Tax=Datura stramonium TaxID=4076 RepID=A0ABS8V6L2_DATST|nr:hypothetical protein [Datura stramonium]
MAITTRSGRKLSETTPIGVEKAEELVSETDLVAEDKVEQLNPAKPVEPEVTENNQGDEVRLLQVSMPPKFQPTRGGARKRIERTETAHHLRNENTDSEGEIQEVGIEEPSPGYQTRSVTSQQAANPQSDQADDSSADGSNSSGNDSDLDEGSGNEATSSPQGTLSQ